VRLRRLLLEAADEDHVAQKLAREVGVESESRRRLLRHCLGHALPPAHYSISIPHAPHAGSPYHLMRLRSSTERRWRSRKMATMMASPTATSAAATAITTATGRRPSRPAGAPTSPRTETGNR